MITITLAQIRQHDPCADGWAKLLKFKGKSEADDEPFPLTDVLDSNGVYDCLWCLRCLPEHSKLWRRLAVYYARQVQHLITDPRSLAALDVANCHWQGLATDEELDAARAAAWAAGAAARAAAWAAGAAGAAGAAARAAARAAAWAARAAAWAAGAAARAAVWAAASDAAEAAWAGALAAAWAAASDAAGAAQTAQLRAILTAGEWVELNPPGEKP